MSRQLTILFAGAAAFAAWAAFSPWARAGSYEIATMLRMRDIIPGTEQVRLLPDGGMEEGGTKAGWKKKTGRWGLWTVGPHVVPTPGACGRLSVYVDAETGGGSHQIDGLPGYQADWRQTFSLYVWLPGHEPSGTAPGVPGEQHICFFRPMCDWGDRRAYVEGSYIFGDFRPHDRQLAPDNKVSYNIKGGLFGDSEDRNAQQHPYGFADAKGKWRYAIIVGDNMADTQIVDFAPPVLRHAAEFDFSRVLAMELRRTGLSGEGERPDLDKALAVLRDRLVGEPKDHRLHNALAAAQLVRFARDTGKHDALQEALSAWEASLAARPDQPVVRHWMKLYRGYSPPPQFQPPAPPEPLRDQPAPDTSGGLNDPASYVRIRDMLPGTEHVSLVANGDFEQARSPWTPVDGKAGFHVGKLESVSGFAMQNAGLFWGKVLWCEAPLAGEWAEVRVPVDLEPGEYVISAYVSPLGRGDDEPVCVGTLGIGFQGKHWLWWGYPIRHAYTAHHGLFLFGTVRVEAGQDFRTLTVRAGPCLGKAAPATARLPGGESRGISLIIDNVAITKASEFRPPILRNSAHLEFRDRLELEATAADPRDIAKLSAATQPAATAEGLTRLALAHARRGQVEDYARAVELLRAVVQSEPDDPRACDRLAAACMAVFLRNPSQTDLLKEALGAWQSSAKHDPDGDGAMLFETWRRHVPMPSAADHDFRVRRK